MEAPMLSGSSKATSGDEMAREEPASMPGEKQQEPGKQLHRYTAGRTPSREEYHAAPQRRHHYRLRSKRRLDNAVYGTAVVALLILAMFFRDNLGLMFIPVFAVILLLIIYEIVAHDIRDLEARVERFILITVIFLLFVSWGLFALSQKTEQVLWYQDNKLGPALEEFQRWSQARGLIQPAHVKVEVSSDDGTVVLPGNLSWSGLRGPSMEPTIFPGNTLLLRQYAPDTQLEEGQIIRFTNGNRTYVHRILAVYEDKVITQGDNSDRTESISPEDITHVVVGVLYT